MQEEVLTKTLWMKASQQRPVSFAVAALCLGVCLGLLLSAPIFGWQLGEGASTVLGSVFGSAFAVSGAVWIAQRSDIQSARQLATHAMLLKSNVNLEIAKILPVKDQGMPGLVMKAMGDHIMDALNQLDARIKGVANAASNAQTELSTLQHSMAVLGIQPATSCFRYVAALAHLLDEINSRRTVGLLEINDPFSFEMGTHPIQAAAKKVMEAGTNFAACLAPFL